MLATWERILRALSDDFGSNMDFMLDALQRLAGILLEHDASKQEQDGDEKTEGLVEVESPDVIVVNLIRILLKKWAKLIKPRFDKVIEILLRFLSYQSNEDIPKIAADCLPIAIIKFRFDPIFVFSLHASAALANAIHSDINCIIS